MIVSFQDFWKHHICHTGPFSYARVWGRTIFFPGPLCQSGRPSQFHTLIDPTRYAGTTKGDLRETQRFQDTTHHPGQRSWCQIVVCQAKWSRVSWWTCQGFEGLSISASWPRGLSVYPKNSHQNATETTDQEISLRLYQGWIFTGSWWLITLWKMAKSKMVPSLWWSIASLYSCFKQIAWLGKKGTP